MYSSANKQSLNMPTVGKSVLSERQTEYTSLNGQEQIIIKIPATMGNMNPLETYLKFRVRIAGGSMPFLAGLDGKAGAYSIFQRCDIYSGLNAVHLETLEGIADFMALWSKYDYDKSREGQRVLVEGYGGVDNTNVNASNGMWSPYFRKDGAEVEYKDIEVVLPLYFSGIFNSQRIWSLMASDGLELRFTLRTASEAIVAFNEYGYDFGSNSANDLVPYDYNAQFAAGNLDEFGADSSPHHAYAIANTNNAGVAQGVVAGAVNSVELMRTDNAALPANARGVNSLQQCPLLVGQEFYYQVDAPANTVVNLGRITGIQIAAAAPNNVELLFGAAPVAAAGDVAAVANRCCGNQGTLPEPNLSLTTGLGTSAIVPTLNYYVNDVELVVGTVITPPEYSSAMMEKMNSEGGLVYEYPSWNLYRLQDNKAPKSSLLIPTLEARAKAIVIVPVRSSWGTGGQEFFNSALAPAQDKLKQYQFLLNNTLAPDLPIQCLRSNTIADGGLGGWNAVAVQEAEKAMERADIKVSDLRNFTNHFVLGRRLSTDQHSYDAKTNEMRLQLEYNTIPTVDKQYYAQMSHIRRCIIRPEGIEVVY
jgi:hypothetical protein